MCRLLEREALILGIDGLRGFDLYDRVVGSPGLGDRDHGGEVAIECFRRGQSLLRVEQESLVRQGIDFDSCLGAELFGSAVRGARDVEGDNRGPPALQCRICRFLLDDSVQPNGRPTIALADGG